jgi:hypothetical protein
VMCPGRRGWPRQDGRTSPAFRWTRASPPSCGPRPLCPAHHDHPPGGVQDRLHSVRKRLALTVFQPLQWLLRSRASCGPARWPGRVEGTGGHG